MASVYTVPLTQLVAEAGFTVYYRASDYEKIRITVEDVSRPGLPMAGFFDHFQPMRLQVMGRMEMSYLEKLSGAERSAVFERYFSFKIPALVLARGETPHPECLEQAKKYDVTILQSKESTSYVVSFLITSLKNHLAPRITRHGVLVDVYGEGMLLLGDSGIGKSEDAVEIKKISETRLIGTAPELIRNYIELRGIGVINVAKLFGMASIKEETFINLIINIVPWSDHEIYDRLGLENQYEELLGVKIPSITIPVTPGRNLAVNLEVAAMNNRQKRMGYNAAVEFTEQINRHFDQAMRE